MLYVMSDIHGEYERYLAMLEQMPFRRMIRFLFLAMLLIADQN